MSLPAERLLAVYRQLRGASGGQVAHAAELDGWQLRMATSDWGDLLFSARQDDTIIGFEPVPGPNGDAQLHPVYAGSDSQAHGEWMADLYERARWHDTLNRGAR